MKYKMTRDDFQFLWHGMRNMYEDHSRTHTMHQFQCGNFGIRGTDPHYGVDGIERVIQHIDGNKMLERNWKYIKQMYSTKMEGTHEV